MDGENDQMKKIAEEKSALRKQLIALTILSFVVSGLFYGITLAQNPYKGEWGPAGAWASFSQGNFACSSFTTCSRKEMTVPKISQFCQSWAKIYQSQKLFVFRTFQQFDHIIQLFLFTSQELHETSPLFPLSFFCLFGLINTPIKGPYDADKYIFCIPFTHSLFMPSSIF